MKLQLLAAAQEDAGSIAQWYESKRDGLGQEFLDVLDSALDEIAGAPLRFAKLESIETDREIRRKILPRFPYLVVFEIREDVIMVIGISHGRQHPQYWLPRLDEP